MTVCEAKEMAKQSRDQHEQSCHVYALSMQPAAHVLITCGPSAAH